MKSIVSLFIIDTVYVDEPVLHPLLPGSGRNGKLHHGRRTLPCHPANPFGGDRPFGGRDWRPPVRPRPARSLTAAGHRLLPHARAMVEAWQLARTESRSTHRTRLLRVAIASTLPVPAALAWLASAQQRAGVAEVEVSEGTADAVTDRWRRGRCDVALFPTRKPIDGGHASAASLWREPYVLAAANRPSRGDARDRWSVKELADTRLCAARRLQAQDECPAPVRRAKACGPASCSAPPTRERCAAAVAAALGVSLMPAVRCLRPGLISAEIRELALPTSASIWDVAKSWRASCVALRDFTCNAILAGAAASRRSPASIRALMPAK